MLNNSGLLKKHLMGEVMKKRTFFKRKDLDKFIGCLPYFRCNKERCMDDTIRCAKEKCVDDAHIRCAKERCDEVSNRCQHCPQKCEEDLGLVENAKRFVWDLLEKRKTYRKPYCKPKVFQKTEECDPCISCKENECQPPECRKHEPPKVECPKEEEHEIKCVPCPPKKKIRKKTAPKVEKCFSIRCPPPGRPPQPCQCMIKYPTLKRDCPGPCPRPHKECNKDC